jgi:hypothetical protein
MAQNTSHAVMAQRKEAHDSLEFLPTPAWGTRALCEWLKPRTMAYDALFSKSPPTEILQFVERLPMVKGRVDEDAASATAYCWLVWRKGVYQTTQFHWLAPCRKRLERPGDYA